MLRYIRLLSRVLEWQKSQDRNGISTTTHDVRIKTEPQAQQHLPSHHHHHHHHSTVTTTIYQAKAAIACLKQENNNYNNNPRVSLPNSRISSPRTGQLLMITTPNNLTSKTAAANNATTSSLYAQASLNGVCPSRLVNGKSTSPAKNGLGSVVGGNNQHVQVTSSSSSSNAVAVSNGCSPSNKRMKTEARDEDEVSQSSARDCSRATTASARKRLKITFGKDSGRN